MKIENNAKNEWFIKNFNKDTDTDTDHDKTINANDLNKMPADEIVSSLVSGYKDNHLDATQIKELGGELTVCEKDKQAAVIDKLKKESAKLKDEADNPYRSVLDALVQNNSKLKNIRNTVALPANNNTSKSMTESLSPSEKKIVDGFLRLEVSQPKIGEKAGNGKHNPKNPSASFTVGLEADTKNYAGWGYFSYDHEDKSKTNINKNEGKSNGPFNISTLGGAYKIGETPLFIGAQYGNGPMLLTKENFKVVKQLNATFRDLFSFPGGKNYVSAVVGLNKTIKATESINFKIQALGSAGMDFKGSTQNTVEVMVSADGKFDKFLVRFDLGGLVGDRKIANPASATTASTAGGSTTQSGFINIGSTSNANGTRSNDLSAGYLKASLENTDWKTNLSVVGAQTTSVTAESKPQLMDDYRNERLVMGAILSQVLNIPIGELKLSGFYFKKIDTYKESKYRNNNPFIPGQNDFTPSPYPYNQFEAGKYKWSPERGSPTIIFGAKVDWTVLEALTISAGLQKETTNGDPAKNPVIKNGDDKIMQNRTGESKGFLQFTYPF